MQPYFQSEERCAALLEELKGWKGTRFQRHSGGRALKGVSADCISFVIAVLINMGALRPVVWPVYVTFGGGKSMLDLLMECIKEHSELQCVWSSETGGDLPELIPGDFFIRSKGDDYHHAAVFAGDKTLWHILYRTGVVCANVCDPFIRQNLNSIWRAYEPAK